MEHRIEQGHASGNVYNNLAWSHVTRGEVTEKTLEYARKATDLTGNATYIHTLATVLAELGRTREACTELRKSEDRGAVTEVRTQDWYVLGRIAEHLGEARAARACFLRVEPTGNPLEDGEESCHTLARRRLDYLDAEEKRAGKP
jgi:hypothetical protein